MLQNNKKKFGALLVMFGALLLFMISTSPRELPIIFLVLPLLWLLLTLMATGLLSMKVLKLLEGPQNKIRRLGYAGTIATVPVGILLLRSIGQLTVKDVGLILILATVSALYIGRLRFNRKIE